MIQIALTLFALSAPAHATSDAELQQLLAEATAAVESPSPSADREAAARALRRAVFALTGEAPGARPANDCIALGRQAYEQTMYPAPALERAIEACRGVDGAIVAVAFPFYDQTLYAGPAFEKAAALGGQRALFGKARMLAHAAATYDETLYPAPAIERAAALVATIPRGQDGCVIQAQQAYDATMYAAPALERAAEVCTPGR
jgi:hypothetical protein